MSIFNNDFFNWDIRTIVLLIIPMNRNLLFISTHRKDKNSDKNFLLRKIAFKFMNIIVQKISMGEIIMKTRRRDCERMAQRTRMETLRDCRGEKLCSRLENTRREILNNCIRIGSIIAVGCCRGNLHAHLVVEHFNWRQIMSRFLSSFIRTCSPFSTFCRLWLIALIIWRWKDAYIGIPRDIIYQVISFINLFIF